MAVTAATAAMAGCQAAAEEEEQAALTQEEMAATEDVEKSGFGAGS